MRTLQPTLALLLLFFSQCLWETALGQADTGRPTVAPVNEPAEDGEPTDAPNPEEPDIPVDGEEPGAPTEAPSLELVEGTQAPTFDQGLAIPTIAPVLARTEAPTIEPTNEEIEPTLLPTLMPVINTTTNAPVAPPTIAPVAPTGAPTEAPITASPTILNITTSAPTSTPTSAPTNATASESPSALPSLSFRPTAVVPVPTTEPTKAPASEAPSSAPATTTEAPAIAEETTEPTVALPPTTTVDRITPNIHVTFEGATEMTPSESVEFQNEMKDWFDSYYNGDGGDDDQADASEEEERRLIRRWLAYDDRSSSGRVSSRYEYQQRLRRQLQNNAPEEEDVTALVRDMDSTFDVTGQDVTTKPGSNIVQYTHTLVYEALRGAKNVTEYALYPFADVPYTNVLVERLSSRFPNAFGDLQGPIAIPRVGASTPSPAPKNDDDGGFWTTPVIAGFASGGGVLLLVCLGVGAYLLGSRGARRAENGTYQDTRTHKTKFDDDDEDDDDHHDMLPTQFQMSSIGGNDDDIISTMDDPTVVNKMHSIDASAMSGGYGDQSVATVDYDYSKAYGGGAGDHSVVSSVGGTLGDATRQTAGEVLAGSAAARAALGASFDDPRGGGGGAGRRMGGGNGAAGGVGGAAAAMAGAGATNREEVMVIDAPAGKLGVVIDTPDDGAPVVHAVKETSVIAHLIQVGDKLIKVDEEDVRSMTAIKVSKLISKKSANPVRRLTIVRTFNDDDP